MKKLFLALCILLFSKTFAQTKKPDFVGFYRERGGIFYIKEDKTFLIVAYATLITGTWDVKEIKIHTDKGKKSQKFVVLTPYRPEFPFSIFGRKNPEIKIGYQIEYGAEWMISDEVYIGGSLDKMQAFFNPSPNCFKSEYIYKNNDLPKEFILADLNENVYLEKGKYTNLFSFLTEEYNDFLIAHTPADQNNSMVYHFLLGANGIEDEDGNPIEKSKEEDFVEEDIKFFNEISTKNPYLNDNYRLKTKNGDIIPDTEFEIIEIECKKYYKNKNDSKDYYELYNEDAEKMMKNKYKKIPLKILPFKKFKPLKTSLFHAECKDGYKNSKRKIYSGE